MRLLVTTILLAVALPINAAAPETGKQKLRDLVRLPTINLRAGMEISTTKGIEIADPGADPRAELESLRQQLARSPEDAELHRRIGDTLLLLNEDVSARASYEKAVAIYRRQAEVRPGDGLLQSRFAMALALAGKEEEAERILREGMRTTVPDWHCRVGLARFLDQRAMDECLAGPSGMGVSSMERLRASLNEIRPTSYQLARAREYLAEANTLFAAAVAASPEVPELYVQRALHGMATNVVAHLANPNGGIEDNPAKSMLVFFPTEDGVRDLRQAAKLSPTNYLVLSASIWSDAMRQGMNRGAPEMQEKGLWPLLPAASRRVNQDLLNQLEALAEHADPNLAGRALESLALIQLLLHLDYNRALATARRAFQLDPAREPAWDLAMGVLVQQKRWDELYPLCEARLKRKDSVRNRLILAKALDAMKRAGPAEEQVRIALRMQRDKVAVHFTLAALLLRRGTDEATLREAARVLTQGKELLEKSDASSEKHELAMFYMITSAIGLAQSDRFDEARQRVREVLVHDPGNEYAKEILAALGQ